MYTPACLPESGVDFTGETAWVYGWGTTEMGGDIEDTLRFLSDAAVASWGRHLPRIVMAIDEYLTIYKSTQGNDSDDLEQRRVHDEGGRDRWQHTVNGRQVGLIITFMLIILITLFCGNDHNEQKRYF